MKMDVSKLHGETGAAWNETAAKYEDALDHDIEFLRAGGNSLVAPERRFLHGLGSWCQRAIHLPCAAGTDTLSLLNQGAAEVVGVDISERMIACARRKSDALAAPASWYCCDVLHTPRMLDGTADLVYTGRGAIPWIMDIGAWARVVARLLKRRGRLYVFEGHPLDWVWDEEASEFEFHPQRGNYFSNQIEGGERWPAPFLARQPHLESVEFHIHERQWTLGQIMNALVEAGLRLERFEEHPDLYWNQFPNIPKSLLDRLPHTFSLLMQKE